MPPTEIHAPALEPVLWQLASSGAPEARLAFLTRLASGRVDARTLPQWQRLARDPDKAIRNKAIGVVAQHDPRGSVDLLVEQLPLVDYATQQRMPKDSAHWYRNTVAANAIEDGVPQNDSRRTSAETKITARNASITTMLMRVNFMNCSMSLSFERLSRE